MRNIGVRLELCPAILLKIHESMAGRPMRGEYMSEMVAADLELTVKWSRQEIGVPERLAPVERRIG